MRKVVSGQINSGPSNPPIKPSNKPAGRSASTGMPVITSPLKGATIRSWAWITR